MIVIEIQHGRSVWAKLAKTLKPGVRREVAVAYLGAGAFELMNLHPGDLVIVDGSDSSVASGHMHLPQIKKMMKAGITLYSRSGLHAKMILLESIPPVALVGSANASQNSRDNLVEAVAVFDDRDAVETVREALIEWRLGVKPIDKAWIDHASTIYRLPQAPRPRWKPATGSALTDPTRPMYLSWWTDVAYRLPKKVENAIEEVEELGVWVDALKLPGPTDLPLAKEGDSVLIVRLPPNQDQPRANAPIGEPARVMKRIGTGPHGEILLLGYRDGGPTHPWRGVKAALDAEGWLDGDGRLTDQQRDAVMHLFRI